MSNPEQGPELSGPNQERVNAESTEIEEASEQVAKEKLQDLKTKPLSGVTIRFMNIGEYRDMLANRELTTREFYRGSHIKLDMEEGDEPTVFDYMEQNGSDWRSAISNQTRDLQGLPSVRRHKELIRQFRKSVKEAKEQFEQDDEGDYSEKREAAYDNLRENLRELFAYSNRDKFKVSMEAGELFDSLRASILFDLSRSGMVEAGASKEQAQQVINYIIENSKIFDDTLGEDEVFNFNQEELREELSRFGLPECAIEKAIDKFFGQYPGYIISEFSKISEGGKAVIRFQYLNDNSKENLRKAFGYLSEEDSLPYRDKAKSDSLNRWHVSYQVGLIIASNVMREEWTDMYPDWIVTRNDLTDEQKSGAVLGAFALFGNNALVEEMVEESKKAEDWSHPIFSSKGSVRYPDEKN